MQEAKSLIDSFTGKRVLIIGDVMIDRYVHGAVDRISPEAPVPVLAFEREDSRLGGAANVALNISALGGVPVLVSVLGQDKDADTFQTLLDAAKLPTEGLQYSAHRRTTVKTRLVSGNQQLLRVDKEDTHDVIATVSEAMVNYVKGELVAGAVDCILFQDYNKGVLTEPLISAIIALSKQYDIPTLVDPKYHNFFAYKGVTLFKPNLLETKKNLQIELDPTSLVDLRGAHELLQERLGHAISLITLSEHGVYFNDAQSEQIVPTVPRNISDVCGAGDTVISVASLSLASGVPMEQLSLLVNIAGGQVCEKPGVVSINKAELIAEYSRYFPTK